MKLTPHFNLEELTHSDTAIRKSIDNSPTPNIVGNMLVLAQGLELVRAFLGKPMSINSGYRCQKLNSAVGGASDSAHMKGFAADFTCKDFGTPLDIVKALSKSKIKFDQIIQEGTWVHISFAPSMRQEILTAVFNGGKVTYRRGI